MKYLELKSGTDVRGTAMGDMAFLTPTVAANISMAFAFWLKERGLPLIIAVGRDSRLTGPAIGAAVIDSLIDCGATVLDCGMCSTPSMFMMTQYDETKCSGSIMITASHHPSDKNGLKFFTGQGGLSSDELATILRYAEEGKKCEGKGTLRTGDFLGLYCNHIVSLIKRELPQGLSGFKIAVDAGNGAGGFFATRILASLGADISPSQYLSPDGTFPFHRPNPEDKQAMDSISARVKETGADIGIIFDTDVDRSAIVSSTGAEINRNRLIALISRVLLENNQGAYIVTDSVTSDGLHDFITRHGGVHIRYKRGYKNVIDFAMALSAQGKNVPLAIETSGHAAFKENYFLDDGAYLAVKLLITAVKLKEKGQTLDSLISDLIGPVEEAEVRLKLSGDDRMERGQKYLTDLEEYAKSNFELCPSYEGVRANTKWGFFMARMSVHDPIIPINIECHSVGGVAETAKILCKFSEPYGLDLTALKRLTSKGE